MSERFFISDTHFGHNNILTFDNRPFVDIKIHDETIINNWNNQVNINDEVYLLGDVSWYNVTKTIEILKFLNGKKHLIIGNHDASFLKNIDFRNQFKTISDYEELAYIDNKSVILCHYPIPCYKNHYYGWYHLYGHVHVSFEANMIEHFQYEMRELYGKESHMYNVGCMMPYMNYTPRTLEEIIMTTKI